ncbi:universal stress protein [Silvimonas sp. JCM 19000]
MTYTSIMVHLTAGQSNTALLRAAHSLTQRFPARLTGLASGSTPMVICGEWCVDAGHYGPDSLALREAYARLEAEMYDITGLSADRQGWRCNSGGEPTLNWLCNSTRGADLLVCAARARTAMSGASDVHLGELVMHTGRPVLVVPGGIEHIWLEHVAVCWSETAEARRAVADAMPILLQSDKVTVVEVVNEGAEEECRWRLRGVVQWLRDHGVRADYRIDVSSAPRAGALRAVVQALQADLVVAGLYGHSRAQQWIAGGVSRDFLLSGEYCVLLSH